MEKKHPTQQTIKKWTRFGTWAGYKHRVMDHLGIPSDQFCKWDVPKDYQDAFKWSCGRSEWPWKKGGK